ncbi:FAD:protein FMN transferase [Mucilaginibacter ginsenosidivorans]|uniref:FAD:protein FMN transferase n=1 Tax=Mucilaginibacter ginsenosidivorans TaxID=398053 RepID=A0A5B8UQV3_9SPHI|nr:FAD:protein FMN transferase [Mucilaginibacter ginsenosidivorans]QEC61282.1 FAD:protein FMN transferase [Mucilaginibacter ginsenosidivorans]
MLAVKTYHHDLRIFRRALRLMGNVFEISVVANDAAWADNCIDNAVDEINRIEKMLSTLSDDSQVTEINRNAGIRPVKVTGELFRLIERALDISVLTQGTFDITYNADKAADLQKIELNSVKFTNYKKVVLNAEKTTVFLQQKGMRIGFSAISKGYAADRAKYILQMMGVSAGVVNAGGDLLTWGLQPNDEQWTIATADPKQVDQPYSDIRISNMAVATSGNFEKNAVLSHQDMPAVIDAKKGFPVSVLKSVSIVSPTAELSDAMATPIMALGVNAGLYLINKLQQLACVIIDDHNRVYTSKEISYLS